MNRIKFKRRIGQVRCAAKYYIVYVISKLYRVHDNAWLIAERGTDARDNGYVFYRYLKKVHPEISVKFVISDTSPDRDRLETGDIVRYGSFEHYLRYITAPMLLSTHGDEDIGKSYNKNELAEQLLQRSKEGYSRNYVIKKNDVVIAHACTNAEIDGVAIVAELIVNKEYRRRGYALEIWRAICEEVLKEGKRVFSFYYSNESRNLHKKVGFHEVCEWGKIVFNNNYMEV